MSESPTSEESGLPDEESDLPEGAWIAIGAAIGMALTAGINPGLIGVGLAFGAALGAVFEAVQNGSINLNTD